MRSPAQKEIEKQARWWLTQAIHDARHVASWRELAAKQTDETNRQMLLNLAARQKLGVERNLERACQRVKDMMEQKP